MARQPRNVQGGYSAGTAALDYADSSLAQHLAGVPTTACVCWKLRALNADGTQRRYAQPVRWDEYAGYAVDDEGTPAKTSSGTQAAVSLSGTHPGTDFSVQFLAAKLGNTATCGFTLSDSTDTGGDVRRDVTFGVCLDPTYYQVVVGGAGVTIGIAYSDGDLFEVK